MKIAPPLLNLEHITVRFMDHTLFSDLSFQVKKGEQWALIGESGSGKSALLLTIAGYFNVIKGNIQHGYYEQFIKEHTLNDPLFNYHNLLSLVQQRHSFRNLSNTTNFYYQQRYNSMDSEDAPKVIDYLSGIRSAIDEPVWTLPLAITVMHLESLLDKQLIKLSNGETRRLLIAAALLKNPRLLLLDNPFTGLDIHTRAELHHILSQIAASGITLILSTNPAEIPGVITHIAFLEEKRIVKTLARERFDPSALKMKGITIPDQDELKKLLKPPDRFKDIVKMENVKISYTGKTILRGISWHIQQGERWALTGPNGAGKSTLLSLINGDNPQAYVNDIILFDRKRGSGESIWDIKKKTGFVSPELLQYFDSTSTCVEIIESGFYDTMGLFRASSEKYADIACRWMKMLEIDEYKGSVFRKVSASAQRLCLLARALVKNPPLLILDEPCQGLDQHQQEYFKQLIDNICSLNNTTLIYVTHYPEEIPGCVTKFLKLRDGETEQLIK